MKEIDPEVQGRYFSELSIRLRHEGFNTLAGDSKLLPVAFNGNPLCQISVNGASIQTRECCHRCDVWRAR
jgi:hypothetical protein